MDRQTEKNTSICCHLVLRLVNMSPTGCSDGVKEKLQVVLAEPVGQDISLSFKQHRNHQHQRVDIDDEAQDREEPSKANIVLL